MPIVFTGERPFRSPPNEPLAGAALCLYLVIATLNLRNRVVSEGIIYVEYLYFIAYFLFFVVTGNALVMSLRVRPESQASDDRELLAINLYWPAVFAFFLGVTVATFYP
ncbi:MAG: hypothetical protein EXQ86_04775 [Rhodospirillales bacterium]|nr:hypothetical protein [Rhodospirillales bacterium]